MKPEEKKILSEENIQNLLEKFCKVNQVYSIYLEKENEISENDMNQIKNWTGIGEYISPQICNDLVEQLMQHSVEEVIEADLPMDYIRLCAVVVRIEQKVVAKWLVGGILKEYLPEGTILPEGAVCTTDDGFADALELFCTMFRFYFQLSMESVEVAEKSQKIRQSEKKMEVELNRSKAITSIVQMLESELDFSAVVEQIFQYAGEYLDIESAHLVKIKNENGQVSMICEWKKEDEGAKKDKSGENLIEDYPVMNGKPYIISSNTSLNGGLKSYIQKQDIKAAIFLPIEVNGETIMYLSFQEHEKEREWEMPEIKFVHDVRRIVQSILTKRITRNSLAGSYASLEEILDNIGSGICVSSLEEEKVLFTNQKFRGLFRKSITEGKLEQVLQSFSEKPETAEVYLEDEERWFDIHRTEIVWVDGKNVTLYTVYDITENKKYQKKIERQANNDFLTGLYNRMRCEEDLAAYIEQTKRDGGDGALLYMDLDDFKHINDGLGHQYGDVLLKAISHSLQRIAGIESTCYRMGGDEFIIIVTDNKYWMLEKIIDEILEIFSKPWFLKGADYYCTASIGIVRFPADGDNVQELIKKADLALFEAKKSGKNRFEFYGAGEESSSFKRLDLEKNMRNATMNACEEFEVYYQPIIDISKQGNPCIGAEALIRWNCENLGFISPVEFIPLAEYLGLINPIGDHVLKKACKSCRYWNNMGHPEYKVHVNLSVVQLLRNDVAERISEILEETKMNPNNLILEVTESLAINDMARMKTVLKKIKELGVGVALDDFGTGYSSLNHIKKMPIDVIKIDRCFIMDLGKEAYAEAFVKIVYELASTIGMQICVEGVENEEQYHILKEMQIQMIQGFYFEKPIRLEEFEKKYV